MLVWPQSQFVSGTVRDQDGLAVYEARVELVLAGKNVETTSTGRDGSFRFAMLPGTTARIRVTAPGFSDLEIPASSEVLSIILTPAVVAERVTVTGIDSRLGDTPQSIVLIARDDIVSDAAPTLDQKLRQIPGFTLFRRSDSRTANPTSQGVSLRGTGGSGASRAAVTTDGFPLNDPFGGWVYWGRIPFESVGEVEVLRGSAGEISGNSTIGGVIAMSTRRPDSGPLFDLDSSLGSQNTAIGSLYTAAAIGRLRASLAAEAFRTDGFIAVAPNERGAVDTRSDVDRASILPTVEYHLPGSGSIFLSGEYFQERRSNGTPLQNNDTKILSPKLGADFSPRQFGDIKFRGWYLSQIYHQSFSSVNTDRTSETLTRLQTVPSRSAGANLQWSKSFSPKSNAFAGAELRLVSGASDEIAFIGGRPSSYVDSGGREFTVGLFSGGSYLPTSRIVLSGGIRFDRWREFSGYSDARPISGNTFIRTTFADRVETAVSPRLSTLVRVDRHLSVTVSFSRGFRQPTLNELYRSFRVGNVLTLSNENLKAERSSTYEGGIISSLSDDRLYLRAVAFCTNIDKPVANVTLSATPTLITRQRRNLGSTRSCGIETDSDFRIRRNFRLSIGYLFVGARVKSFSVDPMLEGSRVPQVPRHQITLQARYSEPKIVSISINLRAATSQFDDDQNQFRLGGFGVVDLFASKRLNRNFELYLAVENLFDTPIESGRTPILTLTNPRAFRVGLRLHFGRRN